VKCDLIKYLLYNAKQKNYLYHQKMINIFFRDAQVNK